MSREIGDKLGVRLSRLVTQNIVATRRSLAPIEARISAAAGQQLIDRAGREVASLHKLVFDAAQEMKSDRPHPALDELLQRVSSGEHQWEGLAGMGQNVAMGALGSAVSNFVFPLTAAINLADRSTPVDANTAALAVAAQLADYSAGDETAGAWGLTAAAFEILVELARNYPDVTDALEMMRRGQLGADDVKTILARTGVPDAYAGAWLALAENPLSAADAALAVLRGNMSQADGLAVAAENGLTADSFNILIGNTGEPPAIEEMLMLNRRGELSDELLTKAILQSRIRNEWIPYVLKLSVEPPSAADVLNALVQGQISESEAETRFKQAGGDPTWFQTAYDSTAESPSPTQLAEMANRGIIPWEGTGPQAVTWLQGFHEGRWKDKWADAFKAIAVYHPPPREIATLVKEGGLSQDQAMALWEQAGLSPDMAHMYWTAAHYNKTTTIHQLAESQITKLYHDLALSRDEAASMLESINWTKIDANYLLDIVDFQREASYLEKAISKINSLYITGKIAWNSASAALATLELPTSQIEALKKTWDLEAEANVKILTAAEVTDAWYYQLMDVNTASDYLQSLGYSAQDAWYLLNIKNKGPIDNFPEPA